jgi:hypothetical protein
VIAVAANGGPPQLPLAEGLAPRLAAFAPVTLAELDRRAALGERLERKYVLQPAALGAALAAWAADFDILEIGGGREFEYRSVYFDDPGHVAFHDHRRQKRQRYKVRTRHYVDSDLCFLEVKLKGRRGATIKRRFPHPVDAAGLLDEQSLAHVRAAYAELYRRPLTIDLGPVLRLGFRRIMLVAKRGGERVAIDRHLTFASGARSFAVDPDVAIVETKSGNRSAIADRVLRGLHQHPVAGCSKYCVGLIATGEVARFNYFLPVLRRLNIRPPDRRRPTSVTLNVPRTGAASPG